MARVSKKPLVGWSYEKGGKLVNDFYFNKPKNLDYYYDRGFTLVRVKVKKFKSAVVKEKKNG